MGASSVTGQGAGAARQPSLYDLSRYNNILITGISIADSIGISSPTSFGNTVVLPKAQEEGAENYVVLLTAKNSQNTYITSMNEDANGKFIGFSYITDADEAEVMYLVTKLGSR